MVNCNNVCQTILQGIVWGSEAIKGRSAYLEGYRYCRRCELYFDMEKLKNEILPAITPDQLHARPNRSPKNRFHNINYCQCCGHALRKWGAHSQSKKVIRDEVRKVFRY